MPGFFRDLRLSQKVHTEHFRRFYREALSAKHIHLLDSRSPLGDLVAGDVVIQTDHGRILSMEEKVSRKAETIRELCLLLETNCVFGTPSLSRLSDTDLLVWAFLFRQRTELYGFGTERLARAIEANFHRFEQRRLFFAGGADVTVLFVPINSVWSTAGIAKAIHRQGHDFLGS